MYEVALMAGDSAEQRVIDAFDQAENHEILPEWLYYWKREKKNSKADWGGIDIVFMTNAGPVFVQVKSSKIHAVEFHSKHPYSKSRVVVVNIFDDWLTTFGKVMKEVSEGYERLMAQAAPA